MAKKRKAKKGKADACCVPFEDRQRRSISVRKIANGYIVNKSSSGPDGYKDEDYYTAKPPEIDIQVREKRAAAFEKKHSKLKI